MWEDPLNCDGGRWVLNLNKNNRTQSLDVYWLNSVIVLYLFELGWFGVNSILKFSSCWR